MPLGVSEGDFDLQSPRTMLVEARAPKSLSNVRSHGPNLGLDVGALLFRKESCLSDFARLQLGGPVNMYMTGQVKQAAL